MANQINIVITAEDKASKPIRDISREMDGGSDKSNKFKSALQSVGGALRTVAVVGASTAIAFGSAGAAIGFNFNSSVEQAQTKLEAFMQDGDKVARTLSWVKAEAAATQFSFTDMADAAANLTPVAKSSGVALEQLVRQAEILAAINPAEGLTGATFSLREALSGDWVSIVDRFNLPRKRINELKEQGVPAMEIISRTLGEMGITYDLVAKQGQTVSARFDQVKDKLTMMAGAAAKPIFDRVSRELDTLGAFNYEALGDRLAGVVSGGISAFDRFIPRVQEVARQVGDYLSPKMQSLWETVEGKLFPSLQKLWREVLEPLVPVLGASLVSALGLVIDAFTLALNVVSPFISFLADNEWIIYGTVAALLALKAAMVFDAVLGATTAAFTTFSTVTLPVAAAAFNGFKALLMTPLVMPAIVITAALLSIQQVLDAAQRAKGALEEAGNAAQREADESVKLIRNARARYDRGEISSAELSRLLKIYAKASGTNYAEGGLTRINEHGPEIVNLPQGSQVIPAYRSRDILQGGGRSAPAVVIENYNSYTQNDETRFFRDLGFYLELKG